jgi:Protein of unknown function (DUF2796)
MKKTATLVLALLAAQLSIAPLPARAQAHEHGAARLDIAVEGNTVSLQFEAPLESLFGFERAPRSAAEQRLVDAGIARLKAGERMFQFDVAAGCSLQRITLTSAALQLGAAAPTAAPKSEHADLDASFEFACKNVAMLGSIEVSLFDAFAKLQRIDVQAATQKGQFKRSLKRPMTRITLQR